MTAHWVRGAGARCRPAPGRPRRPPRAHERPRAPGVRAAGRNSYRGLAKGPSELAAPSLSRARMASPSRRTRRTSSADSMADSDLALLPPALLVLPPARSWYAVSFPLALAAHSLIRTAPDVSFSNYLKGSRSLIAPHSKSHFQHTLAHPDRGWNDTGKVLPNGNDP